MNINIDIEPVLLFTYIILSETHVCDLNILINSVELWGRIRKTTFLLRERKNKKL